MLSISGALIVSAVILYLFWNDIMALCHKFFVWFEQHLVLGMIAFSFIFVGLSILTLSGDFLIFGLGLIFAKMYGPITGFFLVVTFIMLLSLIGAFIGFYLSRKYLHNYIKEKYLSKI